MATDESPRADEPATKFLFELSFDEEPRDESDSEVAVEAEPDIPPPPPEPTFSETELNAARAESFKEGHAAGLNEAGTGIEQRATAALEAIATRMAELGDRQDSANRRVLNDLIVLNRRILEMVLPAFVERHGVEEIDALVSDCLTRVLDPGQIVVEVPAESAEALETRLRDSALRVGFAGTLEIRAAPDLGPSDVRLSWQNGGAARSTDTVWQEISEAVDRALHSLTTPCEAAAQPLETTSSDATPAAHSPPAEPDQEELPAADTAAAATTSHDPPPKDGPSEDPLPAPDDSHARPETASRDTPVVPGTS